jgi:hypothetical protein
VWPGIGHDNVAVDAMGEGAAMAEDQPSSANPHALFDYHRLTTELKAGFLHDADVLEQILIDFRASCTEYDTSVTPAAADLLRDHAYEIGALGEFVKEVGLNFLAADKGVVDTSAPVAPPTNLDGGGATVTGSLSERGFGGISAFVGGMARSGRIAIENVTHLGADPRLSTAGYAARRIQAVAESKAAQIRRSTTLDTLAERADNLVSGYYGGLYGSLGPRLLTTAKTYVNLGEDTFRGRITEPLWRATHNANPLRLIRQGWAWLEKDPNKVDWDGGITGLWGKTRVQIKSVRSTIKTYNTRVRELGDLASSYRPDERLLVNPEVVKDVAAKSKLPERVASNGVSSAEATAIGETTRGVVQGKLPAWKLAGRVATKAAGKAGVVGAVISGGLSSWQNIRDYRAGTIDKQTVTARIVVDTTGGALSAASGAMIGAAVGSIVPGAGTVVGGLIGFGLGAAVSMRTQALWDQHVKEPASNWLSHRLKKLWP